MKLSATFSEAMDQATRLVDLYDLLVTGNQRAIRKEWESRFLRANLVNWPKKDGLWRSRNSSLLIVGRRSTGFSHETFSSDSLCILLRSALVLALAAVDKILHEAISKHFSRFATKGSIDDLVDLKLSKAYAIAQGARRRTGRGGRVRPRPGHKFKSVVMDHVYGDSYLSIRKLERVTAACGKNSIFTRFAKTLATKVEPKEMRHQWSRIYRRRNQIAHECDIVRKDKPRKATLNPVSPSKIKEEIDFANKFGMFLASELE